jgi:hypothetical protein
MTSETLFPSLEGFEETRQTLHAYSKVLSVLPRAHAAPHPKWWHISLKVRPEGLVTDNMPLPGGGIFSLGMDLRNHNVLLRTSWGTSKTFSMLAGLSATAFGDQVLAAVAELGISAEYARKKFEDDDPLTYDPKMAENFFTALVNVDHLLKKHRATLSGEVGPVQLWPHGFDLAFEWFGTRQVEYEEHGKVEKSPAQLNLGFYPGQPEPYFYSNPWPFEEGQLVGKPLPAGARWFTDSWQGTHLRYADLAKQENPAEKLLAFAKAVYEISSPTLLA